jgi:hypothetical protein
MTCPSCGAQASGKFCSSCGANLSGATCPSCGAAVSPGAKFCHKCGAGVGGGGTGGPARSSAVPWVVAAGTVVVLLVVLAVTLLKPGGAPAGGAPVAGPAAGMPGGGAGPVDLSSMTPRDAADRLFNRVMSAEERGIKDTAQFFAPMAIQAYGMVGDLDADARYHLGLLNLVLGNYDAVDAEADSIAREVPTHLYASILRAEAARGRGDTAAVRRAERRFLDNYDAEAAAARPEYAQHQGVVKRFRDEARADLGQATK